jgi:flagellar biosynthesis protein FlhG
LGQATSFVDAYALIKNAYIERRITQFSVVVNMADNKVKAQAVFDNFERTVCGFLPVSLLYTGFIPLRDAIARSSKKCKPIVQAPGEKYLIEHIDGVLHRMIAAPRSTSREAEALASSFG